MLLATLAKNMGIFDGAPSTAQSSFDLQITPILHNSFESVGFSVQEKKFKLDFFLYFFALAASFFIGAKPF